MSFASRSRYTWQLRTQALALGDRTRLMGIVNLTPDSFSGDGLAAGTERAVEHGLGLLEQGADLLDLGAESTRPRATPLSATEEQSRLLPVLEALRRERPKAVLSVDTYHAVTARAAVLAGAEIVNDVSGLLWDTAMPETIASLAPGLVLMHTRGTPQTWHTLPPLQYAEVTPLVRRELWLRLAHAERAGIPRSAVVLDPGFGFGKLGDGNLALLGELDSLRSLDRPLLVGLSRKGFLAKALEDAGVRACVAADAAPRLKRLHPTLAANVAAILQGAHILRVHDVGPAAEAAAIADALLSRP